MIAIGAELEHLPVLHRGDEAAERLADAAVGDALLGGHRRPSACYWLAVTRTVPLARSSWRSTVRLVAPSCTAISA